MSSIAKKASALVLAAGCWATTANAHISLEAGGTHLSRLGDAAEVIKQGPCGVTGSTRGTNVYTYRPGETIQIKLVETIPHPGYFRIAFDDDGDDDFLEPRSIDPVDPNRPCPFNAADKCGTSDFDNNATVLMDNVDPHVPTAFVQATYDWSVTLPTVTCDNCTLQVIQVMEDTIHGAYNPVPGDPADIPYIDDIYHQCIDLTLAGDAPAGTGGGANAGSSDSGGCSLAGTSRALGAAVPGRHAAVWVLGVLGLGAAFRRRFRPAPAR